MKDVTLCVKDITLYREDRDYPKSGGVQLLFAFNRTGNIDVYYFPYLNLY